MASSAEPQARSERAHLENVTDDNWRELTGSERAVLLLAREACPACRAWTDELIGFLERDTRWSGVRFGKVVIDGDRVEGFIDNNRDWLRRIPGVPFTVVYRGGQPQTSFAGGGAHRMERRLERAYAESADAPTDRDAAPTTDGR